MTLRVRRQAASQWGVYLDGTLVEGGFFTREAAEDALTRLLARVQPPQRATKDDGTKLPEEKTR